MEKVICPHCKEEGLKSFVQLISSARTLMGWRPFYYDEEGSKVAGKDPNYNINAYKCTNGHYFKLEDKGTN